MPTYSAPAMPIQTWIRRDHARVTQRIGESVRILAQYGATTRADLVRMFARAEYDGTTVALRVRSIIEAV